MKRNRTDRKTMLETGVGAPLDPLVKAESNTANMLSMSTGESKLKQSAKSGFTLVEIMVVLVVIGILAAAIIPQFIGTTHDAKVSTAKANVAELESALGRFYVNMDRYPTGDEGLKVLVEPPTGEEKKWRGPYVTQVRPDPWGNPFQYRVPGVHHTATFDIWSRGADGADGGEGEGSDLGNW